MENPALLPELFRRVIELAKEDFAQCGRMALVDVEAYRHFLAPISLVCRMWAEESRAQMFESVKITFGSPGTSAPAKSLSVSMRRTARHLLQRAFGKSYPSPNRVCSPSRSAERMEQLLSIVRQRPLIARLVKTLDLSSDGENATDDLNASSEVLLALSSALTNVRAVKISWEPMKTDGQERSRWVELDDGSKSVIAFLLLRPTLRALTLKYAAIPCAFWDSHTIQGVKLYQSACKSEATLPLQGRLVPLTFGCLTQLTINEKLTSTHVSNIQEVLFRNRQTLKVLRIYLDISPTELPLLDLTFMSNLKAFDITFTSAETSPTAISAYLLQALATFPWAAMEFVAMSLEFRCPPSTNHTLFDAKAHCNSLDAMVARKAKVNRKVGMSDSPSGPSDGRYPLQFIQVAHHVDLCDACQQLVNNQAAPPSSLDVQNFFPRLYDASERVGTLGFMAVAVFLKSPIEIVRRIHVTYLSAPVGIREEVLEFLQC